MPNVFSCICAAGGAPAVVGLALAHAWILAPFLSGDLFYVCFHAGFSATLLACALRYGMRPCAAAPRRDVVPWVSAMLMCASSLTVFAAGDVAGVDAVCGVLGGIGSAYCFARWFWAFCTMPLKTAVDGTLLAFALSGCVRLVLVVLPSPVVAVLLAVLPFASVGCLGNFLRGKARAGKTADATCDAVWGNGRRIGSEAMAGGLSAHEVDSRGAKPVARVGVSAADDAFTVGSLAAVAVELAVYGLAFGLLRNGINEWSVQTPSMLLGHCLRIVLPLLLLWWFQLRARGSQSFGGLRIALLAVAVALLAVVFLCGLGPSASSAIVLAARSLVSVLIYLRLFDVVRRCGFHPCAVYGVGRGVYEVALVLGLLAYAGLKSAGLLGFMTPAVTYFFVSCILLVMLNGFAGALKLPFLQPEPGTDPTSLPFDDACERLARERDLTERELQIMKLVVKGHTKKRIAEVLNLSEDTIRYHTKSLYRKLDVHSRQDLLDVLGID